MKDKFTSWGCGHTVMSSNPFARPVFLCWQLTIHFYSLQKILWSPELARKGTIFLPFSWSDSLKPVLLSIILIEAETAVHVCLHCPFKTFT